MSAPIVTRRASCAVLLATSMAMYAAADAGAQTTRVWTPGDQGSFTDPNNYDNGAPVNGDSVTADGAGASIINYGAGDDFTLVTLGLNVSSGASVFNQSGGTLSLTNLSFGGGGGSRNPTYNLTGGTLNVSTAFTWGNGNNARFNFGSGTAVNYGGSGFYTIGGAGGANGAIVGTGGVFNANSVTALRFGSSSGTGGMTLSGNAAFNGASVATMYLGNNNGSGNLTLSGTAEFNTPAAVISVGQFGTGAGTLTMSGTSTLTAQRLVLGGDNSASSVTGVANLNGGTLITGQLKKGSSNIAASATANVINANGGTIRATTHAGNSSFFDGAFVNLATNGLAIDTNGNDVGINNAMSGVGGLTKLGAGTLSLTGANSYAGATTVTAGTLRLGASDVIADTSVLVLDGGTLVADGEADLIGSLGLTAASVLQFGAADTNAHALTFAESTGTGDLTVTNWSDGVDRFLFTSLDDAESIAALTTFLDPNGVAGSVGAMAISSGDNFAIVPVPEPASFALLGLGGLVMLARRRQG